MASKNRSRAGMIGLMKDGPDKWQIESDLETLIRAKAICKDKKRYAKCVALAKEKSTGLAAVAGGEES